MRRIRLSSVGIFALLVVGNAQAASAPYDGTYRFVSAAKVNETYTSYHGQTGMCPDRKPGPLHIQGTRVRYTAASGNKFRGTVGPQGELTLRSEMVGGSRPFHMDATGNIDGGGVAHIRQRSASCSYGFTWQR
jgi:hypothetical protein